MSRFRTLFRRIRSIFWTALTLVTILAAILVGVGKMLMPYSARYQPQLETWLSEEFGQTVKIDSFTGEWKAFGPRISLEGVTFMGPGAEAGDIAIQHAALDIKPINALLPGKPLYSFQIIGADLALAQQPDGRWELSGLGVSGRSDSDRPNTSLLEIVGELRLENSRLSFSMPQRDITSQFTVVSGRLQLNGSEIAAEIQANITDQAGRQVLGDVKATLLLTLDEDQRLTAARWHAKTGELIVGALAQQLPKHPLVPADGRLNAELWGQWGRDQGQDMQGVFDLRDAALSGEPDPLLIDHMNARFDWRFLTRKSWRLDFSEFEIEQDGSAWGTDRLSVERNIPGNLGLWVSADQLEVSFPLELTQRIMAVYRTPWPNNAPRRASGQVAGFDLVLDRKWKLYKASGHFQDVDAFDWGRWPDVSGVEGDVDLFGGDGQVHFSGAQTRIEWPRNFRQPLIADIPGCVLDIGWGAKWQVHAHDCSLQNEQIAAHGTLHFAKTEGKPAVDINVAIERARIAELDAYWPRSLIKPRVSDWLSKGLVSGTVTSGAFSMRGDMDDWPFSGHEGLLEARVDFEGLNLDYYPGWPRAGNAAGTVMFRDADMSADANVADLSGNPVQQVHARVRNLRAPLLELDFDSQTTLPGLAEFIRQSPLLEHSNIDTEPFGFSGDAAITGSLRIPIGANGQELAVKGEVRLPGNGFTEQRSAFSLTDIVGTLAFDQDGLSAPDLTARYREHDSQVSIQSTWRDRPGFRSELRSVLPIAEVIPEAVMESEPLLDAISGEALTVAVVEVKQNSADQPGDIWLDISSDLAGVSIDLPAPLDKAATESWPLNFRYPIRSEVTVCSIRLGERLNMLFDIPNGFERLKRAHFQLGPGPAELPAAGEFRLAGDVSRLDADAWVRRLAERFEEKESVGSLKMLPVLLHADQLRILDRDFSGVELEISYEDGILSGSFDSEDLAGGIRYSRSDDGSHSLTAQLDRLFMPPADETTKETRTDPSLLPEMHIYIDRFSYLGLDLGQTRIEAYPRQGGFRFASVEANSPDFTLNARGDWVQNEGEQHSDFDIVMTSESLGSLIDALDISSVLEGGQTVVRYDASWPGSPADFALARLNGEMNFNVIQGTIINADAGAGRMVGLMSIAALPRRLALDFRDVFGTGFSFDEAGGTISLENGIADTNDLVLKSTAARMEIRGSSNLDAQTFDYILSIKPGVGQALPVLGAIAGGPGGAAAGLALQGLLQKSLGEAAEARYSITGPWKNPLVVRIPMEPQQEKDSRHDRPATDR